MPKKIIAIDIDDVVAHTGEAIRVWVNNQTGKNLTLDDYYIETNTDYWHYYTAVWEKHGIKLDLDKYLTAFSDTQADVGMVPGAKEALRKLSEDFKIVFVTSRDPATNDATQEWFLEHLGYEMTIHFASAGHYAYGMNAPSKGEIVKKLGASVLIDDNPEHVQSALDHGVEGILFGKYGWQINAPEHMKHMESWAEVVEYLRGLKQRG